ncbi:hypothetical protein RCL1_009128 [Eukaryota sp. TZLM3-RCL]
MNNTQSAQDPLGNSLLFSAKLGDTASLSRSLYRNINPGFAPCPFKTTYQEDFAYDSKLLDPVDKTFFAKATDQTEYNEKRAQIDALERPQKPKPVVQKKTKPSTAPAPK